MLCPQHGRKTAQAWHGMAQHDGRHPNLPTSSGSCRYSRQRAKSQMGAVLLGTMCGASNACWWLGGGRERDHRHGLDWTSSRMYTAPSGPWTEVLLLFWGVAP